LSKYRWWVFGFICATLWTIGWYNKGARDERSVWVAKEMAIQARQIEGERKDVKTAFEIGSDYENTKERIDNSFAGYINRLQSGAGNTAMESNSTSKPNEKTTCAGLPERNKRKLLELARQAELNTQQLISLQRWIEETR